MSATSESAKTRLSSCVPHFTNFRLIPRAAAAAAAACIFSKRACVSQTRIYCQTRQCPAFRRITSMPKTQFNALGAGGDFRAIGRREMDVVRASFVMAQTEGIDYRIYTSESKICPRFDRVVGKQDCIIRLKIRTP